MAEGNHQRRHLLVAPDPPERALGFEHAGGNPTLFAGNRRMRPYEGNLNGWLSLVSRWTPRSWGVYPA